MADDVSLLDKPILVPLTTSLYVPGTLAETNNVIVDVGTGFYVEKVRQMYIFDAASFANAGYKEHRGCDKVLQ